MSKDIRRYLVFLALLETEEGLITSEQIEDRLKKEGLSFSSSTLSRDYKFLEKIGFKIHNPKTKGYKLDIENTENYTLLTNLFKRIALSNLLSETVALENGTHKFLSLDDTSLVKNFAYFDTILKAINDRKEISFRHTSFYHVDREAPKTHTIKPHLLKEYRNRWYVMGETEDGFRVFGLDRIDNLQVLNKKPFKNKTEEANQKLANTVGLNFKDYKPESIILRFHESQKPYIESLKLHHSQKEAPEHVLDGFYVITIFVTYNFELKQQLLKYGSLVEVLKPDFIREDVRKELENALTKYN